MNLPGASKVSDNHCAKKDEKSCEMRPVESTELYQRLIHGEVRTEACKMAVGAFVLALVGDRLYLRFSSYKSQVLPFFRWRVSSLDVSSAVNSPERINDQSNSAVQTHELAKSTLVPFIS